MLDPAPAARKRRDRLYWAIGISAFVILALFLLLQDEELQPVEDMMPKRPVIAWDERNGWKRMIEWAAGVPELEHEEFRMISAVAEMSREPEREELRMASLKESEVSELQTIASLPHWQDRLRADLAQSGREDIGLRRAARYRFLSDCLLAMEEENFPALLTKLRLGATLQQCYVSGATSLLDFVSGSRWFTDHIAARALVRMELDDDDLTALDRLLEEEPFSAEDCREVLRHDFRAFWNLAQRVKAAPASGLRGRFFAKNRLLNSWAREWRADIELAMTAPFEAVREVEKDRAERQEQLAMWTTLDPVAKLLDGGALIGPTADRVWFRSPLAPWRAVRVIVALHRHNKAMGALPATLDELVPRFLPAVPKDPFDFKPLRWDAAKRVVYSIGADGTDQPSRFDYGESQTGWWPLIQSDSDAPGARFRTKADGPDFPPGTNPRPAARPPGHKINPPPAGK